MLYGRHVSSPVPSLAGVFCYTRFPAAAYVTRAYWLMCVAQVLMDGCRNATSMLMRMADESGSERGFPEASLWGDRPALGKARVWDLSACGKVRISAIFCVLFFCLAVRIWPHHVILSPSRLSDMEVHSCHSRHEGLYALSEHPFARATSATYAPLVQQPCDA